jgi:Ca2+-binding EF-hand superfamily protein
VETAIAGQNPVAQAQAPVADANANKDVKIKEEKVAEGEAYAKQMLVLMDRDKSGKVSRQEYMDFMAAEFERLDKNKDGELDVKELTQVRLARGGGHR